MRLPGLLPLFLAAAATTARPVLAQPLFDPAADYITVGQDEQGYRAWFAADPGRAPAVAAYYAFLVQQGVAGVVPTWQLLRTATDWQRCAAQPFEVPPADQWPHLVQALAYLRAHVVPAIGPVQPVSVYRNPMLNACAGGAAESAHQLLYALDLVPLQPMTRDELIRRLCPIHLAEGARYGVGLGFYKGVRFHVDTKKFRTWGGDLLDRTWPCVPTTITDPLAPVPASGSRLVAPSPVQLDPLKPLPDRGGDRAH